MEVNHLKLISCMKLQNLFYKEKQPRPSYIYIPFCVFSSRTLVMVLHPQVPQAQNISKLIATDATCLVHFPTVLLMQWSVPNEGHICIYKY